MKTLDILYMIIYLILGEISIIILAIIMFMILKDTIKSIINRKED